MMLDDFAEGYLGIFPDARQSDMEVSDTLRSIEDAKEGEHYHAQRQPRCRVCGSEDISANVPGYLVDRMEDFPPPYPMVCERCGEEWDDD